MSSLGRSRAFRTRSIQPIYGDATRSSRRAFHALALIVICWLLWSVTNRSYEYTHPSVANDIKRLHKEAKSIQSSRLYWQSNSLKAARREYVRRYKIEPPKGYDAWYAYAVDHESPIVDDFDDVTNDLKPFRGFHLGKCDLSASSVKSNDIVRVCAGQGLVGTDGFEDHVAKHLVELMESVVNDLPNMCVVMNTLGQPRTVIHHSMLSSLYGPFPPTTCEVQRFQKMDKLSIWDDSIRSCAQDSNARSQVESSSRQTKPQVIRNWTEATALCHKSSVPASGLLRAPEHARISNVVRPLLSTSTLSTFHDIRIPGPFHMAGSAEENADSLDWEDKKPLLAWRGDSSGGWAREENWRDFQRQRMVALAEGKDHDSSTAPARPKGVSRNDIGVAPRVQRHLEIGFTNITSCEASACEVQERELGVADSNSILENKLVLSMDGSGADKDLYRLLKSNSAVVKQGIVREWHDSRLVPWLHFIPVSMEMDELSEMLDFLLGEGDYIAKAIAEAGKEWARTALRKEDMNVYMYRLLIEMGRRDA